MTQFLLRVAQWFRLVDDDNQFSLTHAAVYVAFACVLLGRQVSWSDWGVFIAAMASYRIKRYAESNGNDSEVVANLGTAVTQLQSDVRKLQTPERLAGLRDGLRTK